MELNITTTEARELVEGLSRPVYYQLDLPTEAGDMHLFENDEVLGHYCLMRPKQGTLVVSFSQAVELLEFYSKFDITCRYYGGGHSQASLPEAA